MMTRDLDDLLGRLAVLPVDPAMDALESNVWARVDALRTERMMGQVRTGAIAVALVMGLTVGGVGVLTAPRPSGELSIFTVEAGLSPLLRMDVRS
ncbi:MAG: hypothetical protein DCF28_10800 [Alphaproteobacteria bacterium]|nr:MAG: hypothetical protein DCF28_10800 [Alphaproteobacteria bacterium]